MVTSYGLAVDIGGTFTDVVLQSSRGTVWVDKALTTHANLLDGAMQAVRQVLAKAGIAPRDVGDLFVHATTIVTNALIERKGPKTALLVTEGFRDILIIRNEHRYDMFDPQIEFPEPIVPRELTFGIVERMLASGTEHRALDVGQAREVIAEVKGLGVRSIAVCLLNAYRNGAHERQLADLIREQIPQALVSLSSEVSPQIREYPRASTTAINAYTMPIVKPYLGTFAARLREAGFPHQPLIMLSNGGLIGIETASRFPVRMIESGPAAGALAASHFARLLGEDRLMSFDMGGTTAKACLIEDGQPMIASHFEADRVYRFKAGSGLPVAVPCVDMIEVGAGGGSIAHVDALGLLKVGPQSAGSEPGPACYGRGGREATVTDANVVLGLLDPDNFLGGEMKLDAAAARRAVGTVAEVLGLDTIDTASGIYRLVSEAMAAATRAHATDRGVDQRGMPLFAFGGAGPVHACQVAELLQARRVVFPPHASVLSAFGALVTPPRLDLVRGFLSPLAEIDWAEASALVSDLVAQARAALIDAGCAEKAIAYSFGADLRYLGQQNELTVWLGQDPREAHDADAIRRDFERRYQQHYALILADSPVEIVSWRVGAQGAKPGTSALASPAEGKTAAVRERVVHAWARNQKVPVWRRSDVGLGTRIVGPALIEERETTIVIPPGWTAVADRIGNVIATQGVSGR